MIFMWMYSLRPAPPEQEQIQPQTYRMFAPESQIPEPYYTHPQPQAIQRPTYDNLTALLRNTTYPHEYEEYVFDCSEMSAYLERELENHGYGAIIAANGSTGHAWVIVPRVMIPEGFGYVYGNYTIEAASSPPYIVQRLGSFQYRPEYIYKDIHEAISARPLEFDWWRR